MYVIEYIFFCLNCCTSLFLLVNISSLIFFIPEKFNLIIHFMTQIPILKTSFLLRTPISCSTQLQRSRCPFLVFYSLRVALCSCHTAFVSFVCRFYSMARGRFADYQMTLRAPHAFKTRHPTWMPTYHQNYVKKKTFLLSQKSLLKTSLNNNCRRYLLEWINLCNVIFFNGIIKKLCLC